MKLKKRQFQLLVLLLICMLLYTSWLAYGASEKNDCDGIIRFHVIANSDSKKDQELKLLVRDGLLKSINSNLVKETMAGVGYIDSEKGTACMSVEQSREYINENLENIEAEAQEIIKAKGYDYEVEANLKVRWIPEKTYGDITFPAGNYEALNIVIGKGEGKNWWCVLFPPLCLIDGENQIMDQKTSEDVIGGMPTDSAIKLKSKTLEILAKYEGKLEKATGPGTALKTEIKLAHPK